MTRRWLLALIVQLLGFGLRFKLGQRASGALNWSYTVSVRNQRITLRSTQATTWFVEVLISWWPRVTGASRTIPLRRQPTLRIFYWSMIGVYLRSKIIIIITIQLLFLSVFTFFQVRVQIKIIIHFIYLVLGRSWEHSKIFCAKRLVSIFVLVLNILIINVVTRYSIVMFCRTKSLIETVRILLKFTLDLSTHPKWNQVKCI